MARPPKDPRDFPKTYFQLLDAFRERESFIITLPYSQAVARRHDLYRFFKSLARHYNSDPYISHMSDIARTVVISLSPTTAKGNESVELEFTINPIELLLNPDPSHKQEPPSNKQYTKDIYTDEEVREIIEGVEQREKEEKDKL